jgi:hypothetical protein
MSVSFVVIGKRTKQYRATFSCQLPISAFLLLRLVRHVEHSKVDPVCAVEARGESRSVAAFVLNISTKWR